MGRSPSSPTEGLNKGAWTEVEDKILRGYIDANGEGKWNSIPKKAGLRRCGKSCRLRWLNYLRPDIKRGNISEDEEELIIRLHKLLGNRWSLIAGRLPGRTDNEIKNYWNKIVGKKVRGQPLSWSTSHQASTTSRNPRRRPIPKVSNDKNPEEEVNNAQCRNCIDSPETQAATTGPDMIIAKFFDLDDIELEDRFVLDFLSLNDNNNEEHKEENAGSNSIANLAGDNEKICRAPPSLNSEDTLMPHEFMLELGETDLQSIASFLREVEFDQLLAVKTD